MTPLKAFAALAAAGLVQLAWAKQVNFDLDLTWQKGAPDGNLREMIFMNDQFPGPELRIDQGDDVEVGFIKEDIMEKNQKLTNCP
jgi:FtsP/CotA-like multicopper oxidase with cupredoxin domain